MLLCRHRTGAVVVAWLVAALLWGLGMMVSMEGLRSAFRMIEHATPVRRFGVGEGDADRQRRVDGPGLARRRRDFRKQRWRRYRYDGWEGWVFLGIASCFAAFFVVVVLFGYARS